MTHTSQSLITNQIPSAPQRINSSLLRTDRAHLRTQQDRQVPQQIQQVIHRQFTGQSAWVTRTICRLNSKLFFNRYPGMYEFITDCLSQCHQAPLRYKLIATHTHIHASKLPLHHQQPRHVDSHQPDLDHARSPHTGIRRLPQHAIRLVADTERTAQVCYAVECWRRCVTLTIHAIGICARRYGW